MTAKTQLSAPKRRSSAEVQQLVAEFVSSGMRRREFCQGRGLSFSTLDRHLKKRRWKRRRKSISSAGRLVPVELAARKSPTQHEPSCGLAVVLWRVLKQYNNRRKVGRVMPHTFVGGGLLPRVWMRQK